MDKKLNTEPVAEDVDISITRAGRFLIYSLWIQSQLSDLIILSKNKELINNFNNQSVVPEIIQNQRYIFWKKDFKEVKDIFEKEFGTLITEQARKDLDAIYYLRNAISHSQVSVGRKYLLYQPKNEKIMDAIRETINIANKEDADLNKNLLKIDCSNDSHYSNNMNLLKRFDETFLNTICQNIGVLHPRIR